MTYLKTPLTILLLATACSGPVELSESTRSATGGSTPPSHPPAPTWSNPAFTSDNDPINCIDNGFITYRNTIKPIIQEYCVGCHGPEISTTPSQNHNGFATDRVSLNLSTWASINAASINAANICSFALPQNPGDVPRMPPPQSEAALPAEDLANISAWCAQRTIYGNFTPTLSPPQQNELLLGKVPPSVTITSVSNSLAITWFSSVDPSGNPTVALFHDDDRQGFDGELIQGCLPPGQNVIAPGETVPAPVSFPWLDWAQQAPGVYYIYACIYDHQTVFCDYADKAVTIAGT